MRKFTMHKRVWILAFAVCAAFAGIADAQDKEAPYKKLVTIEGITEYRLANGVRFLLFPDPASSKVTVNLTVFVGSRHEGYGETGMAHLLEHMLFKGCKAFPNVDAALKAHGAQANGTTWTDRTNYYETMDGSDENLEFGIHLEADRLVNSFIKREDLAKEMTVVRNEFEQGENDPESILNQRMMAVAFEWHNYGKSTIGNRSDIERVPIERLQAFYKKFYQPDNVMLVIAGKFDEAKAKDYVVKYFGALPRPNRKLETTYTEEPAQDGERVINLRRVGNVSVVGLMYHIPAASHEEHAAVEILSRILGTTPSGRLYKALVDKQKASRVTEDATAWHDPGILEFTARVADKSTPEEVRDLIIQIAEGFGDNPATKEEVERAKQEYLSAREQALTKSQQIALELSEWAGAGDWRLLFIHRDRVEKVTPEDVNKVAAKYLRQTNRTVGMFLPSKDVARTFIPNNPDIEALVKDYKGGEALAAGEAFDPSPENIEKRVKRLTLASGIKVALLPKKTRGEAVVGTLALHFGNEKSLTGQTTAADFVGPLMMRGTKKHNRQEIQDLLAKLKSSLGADSDTGVLTFSWQSKKPQLPAVLDLLREVMREPTFPESEFEILRRAKKQQLEKDQDDPQTLAFMTLFRTLSPYPKDNIRYQPTIPEALERLEKTTHADVVRIYKEQIGGQVGEITLVGDFDVEPTLKQLEGSFKDWKTAVPYQRIDRQVAKIKPLRENILTPDKEGATFAAAHLFPYKDTDADYPALRLSSYALGGSLGSRLWNRLREKEGLCYGVGSQVSADAKDPYATFLLYAICNPENIDKVDKGMHEEVAAFIEKGMSAAELDESKKGFLLDQKVKRGNDATLAGTLRQGLHLGRTFDYYADLERKVADLSVTDVNRAVAAHLHPSRLVIIRAGDFKKK